VKIHRWNATVEARRNPPWRDGRRSGGLRRAASPVVTSAWVGSAPNPPYDYDLRCGKKDRDLFLSAIQIVMDIIARTGDVAFITDGEQRYGLLLFVYPARARAGCSKFTCAPATRSPKARP